MTWDILLQSDVEPYATVTDLLAQEDLRLHGWRGPEPSPELPYEELAGLFSYGHAPIGPELMDRCPALKVISNYGVGCDHIDLEAARQRGIAVGNTPGVLDAATADLTWALLLAAARNVVTGDRYARSPRFTGYDPADNLGQQVTGARLGIVGLGRIGYQVARRAAAFDMEICYHNRGRNRAAERDLGARWMALDELLGSCDFVTLNCPLTPATRGLIGATELARMKPEAVIVNVARGPVWDQQAVLETLAAGHLHAAATDVTDPEPLPRDHPLLGASRLVLLPHLGSATRQTRDAMARMSVANLTAGLAGAPVPDRIA